MARLDFTIEWDFLFRRNWYASNAQTCPNGAPVDNYIEAGTMTVPVPPIFVDLGYAEATSLSGGGVVVTTGFWRNAYFYPNGSHSGFSPQVFLENCAALPGDECNTCGGGLGESSEFCELGDAPDPDCCSNVEAAD